MLKKIKEKREKIKDIFLPFFLTIFFFLFSFYSSSYAACDPDTELETDFGCFSKTDPLGFTTKLYEIGLGLIGGVALLVIIYGGFLVLSSKGDQNQLKKGKSYIISAIVGLLLAVVGFSMFRIIGANVIKIPGFQ